ncbi:hypothetical protein [Prevotella dentasini]
MKYMQIPRTIILTFLSAFIPLFANAQLVMVGGVEVTKQNASDLTKYIDNASGKISYDYASHTLTMENVKMACEKYDKPVYVEGGSHFILQLKGENIITTSLGQMELGAKKNTITGKGGILRISTPKPAPGLQVNSSELIITGGCTVEAEGEWGITGDNVYGTVLRINGKDGTVVKAKGKDQPSICDFGEIYLEDCAVTNPVGAEVVTDENGHMRILKDGGDIFEQVVIRKVDADYDLTVNGVKVDAGNAGNVLGDGKVVFNAKTRTLTMNGASIAATGHPAIEAKSDVAVLFRGENTLSSDVDVFNFEGETILTCNGGTVSATSQGGAAIRAKGNLSITGMSGELKGKQGIWGEGGDAELKLAHSKLKVTGTEGCMGGFKAIVFDGCQIYSPKDAKAENGQVTQGGAVYKGEAVIGLTEYYPLHVCNVQVSTANCDDILGNGTASYDIDKHVLTLDNFRYEPEDFIQGVALGGGLENVTIVLKGDNFIKTGYFGISMTCNTTITGTGTLTIQSNSSAMVVNGVQLTIDGQPTIMLDGDAGLSGFSEWPGYVKFISSNVKIKGGFVNFAAVEFEGCSIKEPQGIELKDLNYVLNDEVYKGEITIAPGTSGIGGTHADRRVKDVIYHSLSGCVAAAPKNGIYLKTTTYSDGTKETVKVVM